MPRRLSNAEWATFLSQVPVCPFDQSQEAQVESFCSGKNMLIVPPWGAVVEWGGMDVLVFLGARKDYPDVGVYDTREVWLTDVTDLGSEWKAQAQPQYIAWADAFWYALSPSVSSQLKSAASAVASEASDILVGAGKIIGETAGGIITPMLQPLALPLVLVGVALLVMYLPRRPA